jgi:hypothetical protein
MTAVNDAQSRSTVSLEEGARSGHPPSPRASRAWPARRDGGTLLFILSIPGQELGDLRPCLFQANHESFRDPKGGQGSMMHKVMTKMAA